jgi:hypothetical protein
MNMPDIEKIRRFSMAAGLILLTYSAAIVKPSTAISFTIFGVVFNIMNPKYISAGIILASLYGLIRFILYGMIIGRSPSKERSHLLTNKEIDGMHNINLKDKSDIDITMKKLEYAFPSISRENGGIIVREAIEPFGHGRKEGLHMVVHYSIRFKPTKRTRILSVFHDVDYTAPIWLNVLALMLTIYRFFTA